MRRLALAGMLLALVSAAPAEGSWQAASSGNTYAKARALAQGTTPTASASGRNVTVSWAAAAGNVPIEGYVVRRYAADDTEQAVGAACAGIVAGTTCTENNVNPGAWRYTVTPAQQSWRGAEGPRSAAVTVAAPGLTLNQSTVSALPATVGGQIAGFKAGQTVTFRLDNQSSGTLLTGSINPSPVQANGTASVSVTLPAGTAAGQHTVFAIGSSGDSASAPITVLQPKSYASAAWNLRDASSGSESDQSDPVAFASDARTDATSNAASLWSTNRYLEFDMSAPLVAGTSPSGVNFNFRFSDFGGGQSCFYFDVRRASTGAVLATHGSSGSPTGCVAGTTLQNFTTALPEVTSTDIANDLRIRVYVQALLSTPLVVDVATVSGTSAQGAFTLYDQAFTDRANGTAAANSWPLAASGGPTYTALQPWQAAFSTGRYLKLTFPGYTPSGATVSGATFTHRYRSSTSGTTCHWFEVIQGSTVIGTHGSTSSPQSCNSSASTYVTDTVSLPEINTPARANGAVIKLYVRNSAAQRSQHDQARIEVTYTD